MTRGPELFDADGLESWLARAEREPSASEELDFLADLVAAAELERARLARGPVTVADAPPRPGRLRLFAAAAAVLLLSSLGVWWLRIRPDREGRLAANDPPRYVAAELRAPGEPGDGAFERAMEPYGRSQWSEAARELTAFLEQRPGHGPARFYLAATHEQLGELERAEAGYGLAAGTPDALLSQHARFRRALVLLALGEHTRARIELEALSTEGGELARNARDLLRDAAEGHEPR
jgi:hypothetical protein